MELDSDKVKVGGGIRKSTKHFPRTLNVEFIESSKIAKKIQKSKSTLSKM